mmetsp:Transcript_5981/g.11453  ORF Transcript_5981/g.11453 Transcript_5981/m.11453 type:complete len:108 (-) Transcript_5981:112-435(-)
MGGLLPDSLSDPLDDGSEGQRTLFRFWIGQAGEQPVAADRHLVALPWGGDEDEEEGEWAVAAAAAAAGEKGRKRRTRERRRERGVRGDVGGAVEYRGVCRGMDEAKT